MAKKVHLALFISLLIAPMAAKQGAQRRLKIMKEKALRKVKAPAWTRRSPVSLISSSSSSSSSASAADSPEPSSRDAWSSRPAGAISCVSGESSVFSASSSPELPSAYRTPKVPTTFSLAINPVMVAMVGFHSPQPRGWKTGAATLPMEASMLSFCSTESTFQL